jgi:hypothetical protein
MKKLNILFTIMALFNFITIVKGQENMVIHLTDNSNVTVKMTDIQRITFNGDQMLLKKTANSTPSTYLLDNINSITFTDSTHGGGIANLTEQIDVHVYLNAYGEIVVESPYSIKGLTVFDLTGRTLTATLGSSVNVNFLSMGIYLLTVETTQGTVSKKFIKNR